MTSDPQAMIDLIPDYLHNRLDQQTHARFLAHLATDADLRRELEEFTTFRELYRDTAVSEPPADLIFEKICRTIDARDHDTAGARQEHLSAMASLRDHLAGLAGWLRRSVGFPWILATAQAALVIFLLIPERPSLTYQTLGETVITESLQTGATYNIVFVETARETDLRNLLISAQATIIAGPSPEGRYIISIPRSDHFAETIAFLEQSDIVRFFEQHQ